MTDRNNNSPNQNDSAPSSNKKLPVATRKLTPLTPHSTEQPQQPLKQAEPVVDSARSIGGWMIVMLWAIAIVAGTYAAQNWLTNREKQREGILVPGPGSSQSLLLRSNRYGQYRVRGRANDQEIVFLVDTGASGISIPSSVASRLGLKKGRAFEVQTANGSTEVYATRLDSLRIGPLQRHKVQAHINPAMDGDVALLGMSFLRHYQLVQRSGELTISHP